MKKTIFNIIVISCLQITSPSLAVQISHDGLGQVLLYPYYVARGDNDTLISIVNNTESIKALKVNFREGENGRITLSFNLYLAPFDSWVANITETNAGTELRTPDNSCTTPYFFQPELLIGSVAFNNDFMTGSPDSGRSSLDRLAEGFFEVIEMGTLDPNGLGQNVFHANAIEAPSGNPIPTDCGAINDAWKIVDNTPGAWLDNPQQDMLPPSGGLSGDTVIINVPGARASAYDAIALDYFYQPVNPGDAPSLHSAPDSRETNLTQAFPAESSVVSGNRGFDVISDTWDSGLEAVSAVLMADEVFNQFAVETAINGTTEWIITFPTKQHHVWPRDMALPPFTETFDSGGQGQGYGYSCETAELYLYNREDQIAFNGSIVVPGSPPPPPQPNPEVCYQVNVLTFRNSVNSMGNTLLDEANNIDSDLFASRLFMNIRDHDIFTEFNNSAGYARVFFNHPLITSRGGSHEMVNPLSGRRYMGLPTIGFAARAAANRSINALFGVGFSHRFKTTMTEANSP